MMIAPHGGRLVSRIIHGTDREGVVQRWSSFPLIQVSKETVSDLRNIARGAFSPLEGFLAQDDFEAMVHKGRLTSGIAWTVPIILDVTEAVADALPDVGEVGLEDPEGNPVAMLHLEEKYTYDKEVTAQNVFATTETKHPGVDGLFKRGDILLGGSIDLLEDATQPYPSHNLPPAKTRAIFEERGWDTVGAFQTRNVPHAGHENMQKTMLSLVDGLMIQPVIGKKKPGDFTDEMIIGCYDTIIENYFIKERVLLNILPTEMRYAGPREAIFHAIVRKNYGCTHMVVGRDHAGVGNYYHPEAAINIFNDYNDIELQPVCIRGDFFYCHICGSLGSERTCPHDKSKHISFSGTEIRAMLKDGRRPPEQIMRPEVFDVLAASENPFVT